MKKDPDSTIPDVGLSLGLQPLVLTLLVVLDLLGRKEQVYPCQQRVQRIKSLRLLLGLRGGGLRPKYMSRRRRQLEEDGTLALPVSLYVALDFGFHVHRILGRKQWNSGGRFRQPLYESISFTLQCEHCVNYNNRNNENIS